MKWSWLQILGPLLLVLSVSGDIDNKTNPYPHFINGRPYHGFMPIPPATTEELSHLTTSTFDQKLDHVSGSTATWNQTYYKNEKYYVSGRPVFVVLGGESFGLKNWIAAENLPFVQWARARNATLIALEHRYYGTTRPTATQTDDELKKYLSSRLAVEDASNFISFLKTNNAYQNAKYIVFGGSYAGSLAMWLRVKHPDLVDGVLASSAFTSAVFDFHDYLSDLGESLFIQNYLANLQDNCTVALLNAFTQMSDLMYSPPGRNTLQDLFQTTPALNAQGTPLTYQKMQMFFAALVATFEGIVRYRGVKVEPYFSTTYQPNNTCSSLIFGNSDALNNLAIVYKDITKLYTGQDYTGTTIDYNAFVTFLKKTDFADTQAAAQRSWLWQQCSEFGFFVSTNDGETPFRSTLPTNFYIDLCSDVFGPNYNIRTIPDLVAATNDFYGDAFAGDRTVNFAGGYDMWTSVQSLDIVNRTYLFTEAGHCWNLYPVVENETKLMTQGRKYAEDCIDAFINGNRTPSAKLDVDQTLQEKGDVGDMKERYRIVKRSVFYKEKTPEISQVRTDSLPFFMFGRPVREGFVLSSKENTPKDGPVLYEQHDFDQIVSHMHPNDGGTFKQRYWVNRNYSQDGGPLFLFISGESEANVKWVRDDVKIMKSAKTFGATVYMLEHRYYGQSIPTPGSCMYRNLRENLNSAEALDDIAYFIDSMNKANNYTNPKWVTFGGSYAGVLSAWFRERYPYKTIGAIASSAPIEIVVDFYQYLMVAEDSIKAATNGPACYAAIKSGFDDAFVKVQDPNGRVELSDLFSLNPKWTNDSVVSEVDVQYFLQSAFGYFEGAIQYNNDNSGAHATSGGGIEDFCATMVDTTKGSELQRVAIAVLDLAKHYDNATTIDNSYANYVQYLKTDNYTVPDSSSRTWLFQTCHEFGYFQSTDIGSNFYGSSRPVNFFINLCTDVFGDVGQWEHFIYKQVDITQDHYFGKRYYNGTNVVFINGKVDPWHALGEYTNSSSTGVYTMLLEKTAHCADMYPPRDGEDSQLEAARNLIDTNLQLWINYNPIPPTNPSIATTAVNPPTGNTATASSGTNPSVTPATSITGATGAQTTAKTTAATATQQTTNPTATVTAPTQGPSVTTKMASRSSQSVAIFLFISYALLKLL